MRDSGAGTAQKRCQLLLLCARPLLISLCFVYGRRMWREVTAGLKYGDIEAATEAKCALEHKQREEVNFH
jgi:hypothetical protein